MTLQDLYDQLAIGELSQVSISDGGTISLENQKKLLPQINLGILELHKRFPLREQTIVIRKNTDRDISFEIEEPTYLKVEKVFGPDCSNLGCEKEYLIDQEGHTDSVYMPTWNIVMLPKYLPNGHYKVQFRAKHDPIEEIWLEELGARCLSLPIPPTHIYALELFIASQYMTAMGFDGEMHEGNNYTNKFEQAINQLTLKGFHRQINTESDNFRDSGWV